MKNFYWLFAIVLILLAACSPQTVSQPTPTANVSAEDDTQAIESTTDDGAGETAALTEISSDDTQTAEDTSQKDEGDTTTVAEASSNDPVIIFRRTGGFAGLDEEWRIYEDGRIEGPNDAQQVDSSEIQALVDLMLASNFNDFSKNYIPLDNCCDKFTYTITFQDGITTKTVRTTDDVPEQPEQLIQIVTNLNGLVSNQ